MSDTRRAGILFLLSCVIGFGQGAPSTRGIYWKQAPGAPVNTSGPAGAHLSYFGGPIVDHAAYYNVSWGGNVAPYGKQLDAFVTQVPTSAEWNTVLAQYTGGTGPFTHIEPGVFLGSSIAIPASNSTSIDDGAIQTQLQNWINAGQIPVNDGNTIYTVLFPPGISITQGGSSSCVAGGFCAYHSSAHGANGKDILYSVMPDQSAGSGCSAGCGNSQTILNNVTSVLSHELAETITDPEVSFAGPIAAPLAWYDSTNGEIGDICNAQQGSLLGWTVQQLWSNSDNNCVVESQGFAIQGGSLTVNQGQSGSSTIATRTVAGSALTLSLSSLGLPAGVTASFTPASVTSGGSATLTFAVSQSAVPGAYPITVAGTSGAIQHSISLTLTIKRGDQTPPVIVPTIAGTLGTNGWYTSVVNLTWSVTDPESGIASSAGCGPVTLTANTGGTAFTCSATNGAGLQASQTVTIKIDQTPPVVTPTVTGTAGTNGWYTSAVNVIWAVSDPESGIVSSACAATSLSANTGGTPVTCSATNGAGLQASQTVTIKIDQTPPIITPTVTGTAGTNGWYTSAVNVSWAASDPESGIASPACAASSLTNNTPGTAVTCSATNGAGLQTSQTVTIKIDQTPPIITPTVTGTAGTNGWYTSAVNVSWAVSDPESGIASPACAASSLTTNTPGTAVNCSATNGAGLTSSQSVTIKIDQTPPVVTPTVTGTAGTNGWYTSAVNITWAVSDPESGIASPACAAFSLTNNTPGTAVTCSASNGAGLQTSQTVTIKIDQTPPVVIPTVTGTAGTNGWYTSAVNVTWAVSDPESGIASPACAASSLTNNTPGTAVNCSATNGAGLTSSQSVAIKIDQTPPVITPTITGTLGANGWYTSNVAVGWGATDPESGVVSPACPASTVTADTAGTTFSCSAKNGAGLSSSQAVTVKIDKTPPVISGMPAPGCKVSTNNNQDGNHGGGTLVKIATVSGADALAGLAPGSLKVTGTSNQPTSDPNNPQIVIAPNGSGGFVVQVLADSSGNSSRVYTLTATASDLAGNSATVTGACTVPNGQDR